MKLRANTFSARFSEDEILDALKRANPEFAEFCKDKDIENMDFDGNEVEFIFINESED